MAARQRIEKFKTVKLLVMVKKFRLMLGVVLFTFSLYIHAIDSQKIISYSSEADVMKKVVLIVGASRGIGLAVADHLSEQGYIVYGTSRKSQADCKNFKYFQLDLKDEYSINAAIEKIISVEGHLDVVINNGAIGLWGPAEQKNGRSSGCTT